MAGRGNGGHESIFRLRGSLCFVAAEAGFEVDNDVDLVDFVK